LLRSEDTEINGITYGTFYDDVTDLAWLDVDSFYGDSISAVNLAINGSDWIFSGYNTAANLLT